MKFDRQLRPTTETSWVVSYGGKTIPIWRTAAILKIVISPYLSEKSSDFDEILYTAADLYGYLLAFPIYSDWLKIAIFYTPTSSSASAPIKGDPVGISLRFIRVGKLELWSGL